MVKINLELLKDFETVRFTTVLGANYEIKNDGTDTFLVDYYKSDETVDTGVTYANHIGSIIESIEPYAIDNEGCHHIVKEASRLAIVFKNEEDVLCTSDIEAIQIIYKDGRDIYLDEE